LSPAYDLNPNPYSKNTLSLNISEADSTQSLGLALSVIEYFHLTVKEAKAVIEEVSCVVKKWRSVAKSLNINNREIEFMGNASRV
jgi:hypothetical protein